MTRGNVGATLLLLGLVLGCTVDPASNPNRCAPDGSCPAGARCYRPTGLGADEPGFCVGASDAGCVSSGPEECNGRDDDCDGFTDEGFDLSSAATCGSCDVRCSGTNPDCNPDGRGGYACGAGCDPSFAMCPSGCKDLQRDELNCGTCALACDAREDCVSGACSCGGVGGDCDGTTTSTCCGTQCVDLNTDAAHCGGCGQACPDGATCGDQQCRCGSTSNCRPPSRCVAGACL